MIDQLERVLRRVRPLAFAFLSLFALSACGPGSGGTGTGPLMALQFSGSVSGGAPGAGIDPAVRLDFDLRIEDRLVELGGNDFLSFRGEWDDGDAGGSVVLVPGRAMLPGGPQPAVLRLSFDGQPRESASVTLTLTSADGMLQLLLNASTLARVVEGSPARP